MRERIAHKEKACQKYQNQSNVFQNLHLSRFMLNDEHNLIGCVINKVASTTFRQAFANLEGRTLPDNSDQPSDKTSLIEHLNNESFHKFIFVREPMERLASCYYDKFIVNPFKHLIQFREQTKAWANRINEVANTSDRNQRNVTFSEFLQTHVLRGRHSGTFI